MKTVRGGLRSRSNARETTGILAHAKCISTLRGTTENDPSWQHSPQYAGDSAPNPRQGRRACFPGSAEITVVLPSKKLTLKEDRLAKQIICHSKKTELPIRIFLDGADRA